MSVPQRWDVAFFPLSGKKSVESRLDVVGVGADKLVGANGAGVGYNTAGLYDGLTIGIRYKF